MVFATPGRKASSTETRRRPAFVNLAIMAVAVPALFCTVALPAYAYQSPQTADTETEATRQAGAQTVDVDAAVAAADTSRETYGAVSAAEMNRVAVTVAIRSYSGPSASDFLANPPYPNFDMNQVTVVAQQYVGVPYVSGGSNPSGFDCSGFTAFVYAQFGIALPHSASRQSANGTPIAPADALPGDLVFMDGGGHVGIYLGGNLMVDAGTPRTGVSVREIYNPNHWFVRYGI